MWSLCDANTGFLLKFQVYTGKDDTATPVEGGLGSRVVQSLLTEFGNKGHEVYVDNFYSSIPLFEALRSERFTRHEQSKVEER